jgi:hypothetical protein
VELVARDNPVAGNRRSVAQAAGGLLEAAWTCGTGVWEIRVEHLSGMLEFMSSLVSNTSFNSSVY